MSLKFTNWTFKYLVRQYSTYHEVSTKRWLRNSSKRAVCTLLARRQVKDAPDQGFALFWVTLSIESDFSCGGVLGSNLALCALAAKNLFGKHSDVVASRITRILHVRPIAGFLKRETSVRGNDVNDPACSSVLNNYCRMKYKSFPSPHNGCRCKFSQVMDCSN